MSAEKPHPAAMAPEELLAECTLRRTRRSGPGGQHRNKVETAVVLTHRPTGLRGEASERRSQEANRRAALFRLRTLLALSVRRSRSGASAPSARWRSRCRQGRLAVRASHEDFPALLAEALDVLEDCGMEVQAAAARLGVTSSQLTKFLKLEPQAFRKLNDHRRQRGLRPLV